jgi:hypothetical protein
MAARSVPRGSENGDRLYVTDTAFISENLPEPVFGVVNAPSVAPVKK